eukprot:365987-Chlamydomonas_euryale.AAC.34
MVCPCRRGRRPARGGHRCWITSARRGQCRNRNVPSPPPLERPSPLPRITAAAADGNLCGQVRLPSEVPHSVWHVNRLGGTGCRIVDPPVDIARYPDEHDKVLDGMQALQNLILRSQTKCSPSYILCHLALWAKLPTMPAHAHLSCAARLDRSRHQKSSATQGCSSSSINALCAARWRVTQFMTGGGVLHSS